MNNVWVKVENDLPPTCTIVDGFNEIWIDEDFNPEGIRECFLADEGYWTSAEWNNDQDCWDADNKFAPTHWEQRVPPYKIEQPSQSNVSEDVDVINCPSCGNKWDLSKHNACECGALKRQSEDIEKAAEPLCMPVGIASEWFAQMR